LTNGRGGGTARWRVRDERSLVHADTGDVPVRLRERARIVVNIVCDVISRGRGIASGRHTSAAAAATLSSEHIAGPVTTYSRCLDHTSTVQQPTAEHAQRVRLMMILFGPNSCPILHDAEVGNAAYGRPQFAGVTPAVFSTTSTGTLGSSRAQNHTLIAEFVRSITYLAGML
jgi:hypothetical protein